MSKKLKYSDVKDLKVWDFDEIINDLAADLSDEDKERVLTDNDVQDADTDVIILQHFFPDGIPAGKDHIEWDEDDTDLLDKCILFHTDIREEYLSNIENRQ